MKSFLITTLLFLLTASYISSQNIKKAYENLVEGYNTESITDQGELFAKSVEIFRKAIEKDTTDAMAWFGLAVIYSVDNFTHKDLFYAWDCFQKASAYIQNIEEEDDKELLKSYFVAQDLKRRSKKLKDNFEIERLLIEDKMIRFVREENDLLIAHRFIKEYPDSRYLENVKHIRNYLEFRKAEKENTLEGFESFIENYPDAAQVEIARNYIEDLYYEKIKKSTDLGDINNFIQTFPNSSHYYAAVKYRDLIAFNEAKKQNTIEAYDEFMSKYPDAQNMTDARQAKMQLVFEKAKKVNTLEAYNEFVEMYPEGVQYVDIFNLKASVLGENVLKGSKYQMEGINWIKGYDNKNQDDVAHELLMDYNGELLILSNTSPPDMKNEDIWFLKINSQGKMKWNRQLEDSLNEVLYDFDLLQGSQFIAAGKNKYNDTLQGRAWILGADLNGSNAWNKNLEAHSLNSVVSGTNAVFYTGGTYTDTDSIHKSYLAKVKSTGKTFWQRYYSTEGGMNNIAITDSNTLVAVMNNLVSMIDEDGYIIWEKQFDGQTKLTGLAVEGEDIYLIESLKDSAHFINMFDLKGNFIWRNLVSDHHHTVDDLLITDQNIIVAESVDQDLKLVWYDLDGNKTKEEMFGSDKKEKDCRLLLHADGSLYILFTIEYRANDHDIILINRFI